MIEHLHAGGFLAGVPFVKILGQNKRIGYNKHMSGCLHTRMEIRLKLEKYIPYSMNPIHQQPV